MDDRNLYGKAYGLDQRGRHKTLKSALDASLKDLLTERNDFFTQIAEDWARLFPGLPARPGRYEAGLIFLYVANAPTSFVVRPKLRAIAKTLSELPNAPKKINLRLEIHAPERR